MRDGRIWRARSTGAELFAAKLLMDSAMTSSALETAKAINDILRLPQQDQGPLGDVISAWLDLEEREEGDQDSGDIEDTGMYEQQ